MKREDAAGHAHRHSLDASRWLNQFWMLFLNEIQQMVGEGSKYEDISQYLQQQGVLRGSSVANIRKYCTFHGINARSGAVSCEDLQQQVEQAVQVIS